jgi:hypothetical protein
MWLLMIVLHAVAALGAFAVGVAAIDPRRAGSHPWTLPALVGLLVAMTVFMIGAMAAHWSDLHASRLASNEAHGRETRHVDDLGFILIALFDGFVIVAAIDLGAPVWIVIPLAVLAVLVGHRAIQRFKSRVATPPPTTTGT